MNVPDNGLTGRLLNKTSSLGGMIVHLMTLRAWASKTVSGLITGDQRSKLTSPHANSLLLRHGIWKRHLNVAAVLREAEASKEKSVKVDGKWDEGSIRSKGAAPPPRNTYSSS